MKRGVMVLFLLMIILPVVSSSACITAVVSDINPSSVGINEEFTVGITLDSCGTDPAKNIVFELYDISKDVSIKEPLKREIGDMGYANSDRFITYHMKTSEDAKPGTYVFKYYLTYKSGELNINDYGSFSVTVTGNEAKINIASSKTDPVLPIQGQTTELTIRVENFGEGNANSVSVYTDHPFKGVKQSFIGTLNSGEDGPAVFTFIVDKTGEFEIPVTISYSDDFGNHQEIKKIEMIVIESDDGWKIILWVCVISVFFILIIIYFFRKNKKKEKIIQQLLAGNHSNKHSTGTTKKRRKR